MKRGHAWPIGVVVILLLTVSANLWVMRVARDDPSFAIEPDYYKKAMQWDSAMAQEGRNRALGWRVSPSIADFAAGRGARLRVSISGSDGAAIRDAIVRVTAFAVARSGVFVEVSVPSDGDGYSAALPIAFGGSWELRFDIRKGGEHLTATHRVEAVPETGPRGT